MIRERTTAIPPLYYRVLGRRARCTSASARAARELEEPNEAATAALSLSSPRAPEFRGKVGSARWSSWLIFLFLERSLVFDKKKMRARRGSRDNAVCFFVCLEGIVKRITAGKKGSLWRVTKH